MAKQQIEEIRRGVLRAVWNGVDSPVSSTAASLSVSRQAVQRHVRALVSEGQLQASGAGRATRYVLPTLAEQADEFSLKGASEDAIWVATASRLLSATASDEDRATCHYGFTEMVNNAIDHSDGTRLAVAVRRNAASVEMCVSDDGVGIFSKVARGLGLSDVREAVLELVKGKVTTDPARHTGEGVFFTSRVFDRFSICSSGLRFQHRRPAVEGAQDWTVVADQDCGRGTMITMELLIPSGRRLADVFGQFSSGPDEYRFSRTQVPLILAQLGEDQLVSRSQAKRVLARVDRFDEVRLDFGSVRGIGQAFADEIFRVFAAERPDIKLVAVNANEQVMAMIRRAQAAAGEQRGLK